MPRTRKTSAPAIPAIWKIALYIRLSREDGKEEGPKNSKYAEHSSLRRADGANGVSGSVQEQKKILLEYVQTHFQEDHTIVDFYIDDGRTGTDDERDDFQRMMEDVESGKVNCIIVKTLSRAFRNYADQGRYLEQVFPRQGVRFISAGNPFVDSFKDPEAIQSGVEIPINGLMNDRYAAKTSADIRRTFDAKRRRGEFIGAFAPYGYSKDPGDKNHLIIDGAAAQVVHNIFLWFVNDGMSKTAIAKKLNDLGIPNPTSYKRKVQRLKYQNPNAQKNDGLWCSSIILNILTNEVYIGNMVQGRHRIISYKVHMQVRVPEHEWYVVANTHEAVIDAQTFAKAQALHTRGARTAPHKQEVYLFSGFLRCADCQKTMRRKTAKTRVYYSCRTQSDKGACTRHAIREDRLQQAVLEVIRAQTALAGSFAPSGVSGSAAPMSGAGASASGGGHRQSLRLSELQKTQEDELQKILSASESLYLDWKSGDITRDDYLRMKASFDGRAARLRQTLVSIEDQKKQTVQSTDLQNACRAAFTERQTVAGLDRGLLAALIHTILIHEDERLTIELAFTCRFGCAYESAAVTPIGP